MIRMPRAALALCAASLVFFGWGCNPFQAAQDKINEKIAGSILGQATGQKVDVSGQNVTVTDKKTGESVSYGEDVKLPDDFPKDAMIYPGAKIVSSSLSRMNGVSAWAMFTSADPVKTVVDWYAKQMKDKGWKETMNISTNGSEVRSYEKDTLTLSLNAAPDEEEKGKTTVVVSYEERAADGGSSGDAASE